MNNIDLQPGDFACIEWNGSLYTKTQHYHIIEVLRNQIHARVPGSNIKQVIPIKHIKKIEKKVKQHHEKVK